MYESDGYNDPHQVTLTPSEQNLSDAMFDQEEAMSLNFMLQHPDEINRCIKWMRKNYVEIRSKGYNEFNQMYALFDSYKEHQKRRDGTIWEIPHVRNYAHPELEVQKYPGRGDEITPLFVSYIHHAMVADDDMNSHHVADMLTIHTSDEDEFRKFLEYVAHYNLWHLSWGVLYGIWIKVQLSYNDDPRYNKFNELHEPPLDDRKAERTYGYTESSGDKQMRLSRLARENKEEALHYLRARRHWEHDKLMQNRYHKDAQFGMAPPQGMERIARSQIYLDGGDEEKGGVGTTMIFPYEKEDDYDYYPLIANYSEKASVLPKLEDLYLESLRDPDVDKYNAARQERMERLPWTIPYGPIQLPKQGEQYLTVQPHGRVAGQYLSRNRDSVHGPLLPGQIPEANSDDSLANISKLSLAKLPKDTDHSYTEMERRRILLKMDEMLKFNKNLRPIYEDVIDHIGPRIAAPPTEYEFVFAQQFFISNKLEASKWLTAHEKDAEEHERIDLFRYYREVRSSIAKAVRDISIDSTMEMEELKKFKDKINNADDNLIIALFDDILRPACLKYMNTLTARIVSLEKYKEVLGSLAVYKSLMFYKCKENKSLFSDDVIWDEIQIIIHANAKTREEMKKKKNEIEKIKMKQEKIKASTGRIIATLPKYNSSLAALNQYAENLTNSLAEEQETKSRLMDEYAKIKTKIEVNNTKLLKHGIDCKEINPSEEFLMQQMKEVLEQNNYQLQNDINSVQIDIKKYNESITKLQQNKKVLNDSINHFKAEIKSLTSQKLAKEIMLLQFNNEKDDTTQELVKRLAKTGRVKTGEVLKHFRGLLDELTCTGTPAWIKENDETYEILTTQYEQKMSTLGNKIEQYKQLNETKNNINDIVLLSVQELERWNKQIDNDMKLYDQKKDECAEICNSLKKAKVYCEELRKLFNEAIIQIKENVRFAAFAKKAIDSASNNTEAPTEAALQVLLKNIHETSAKNQQKKLKIASLQTATQNRAATSILNN